MMFSNLEMRRHQGFRLHPICLEKTANGVWL
jgi:hypothetical protein